MPCHCVVLPGGGPGGGGSIPGGGTPGGPGNCVAPTGALGYRGGGGGRLVMVMPFSELAIAGGGDMGGGGT